MKISAMKRDEAASVSEHKRDERIPNSETDKLAEQGLLRLPRLRR